MSDILNQKWSKEDDFFSSGPVDPCADLREYIAELEQALAEKEQQIDAIGTQNALLVVTVKQDNELIRRQQQLIKELECKNALLRDALLHGTLCLKPESESFSVYMEKMQAAVDGGALDEDGDK